MATKNKTTYTEVIVRDFINSYVDNEQKKEDSFQLVKLMQQWSGFEPKMWGAYNYRLWKLPLQIACIYFKKLSDINIDVLEKLRRSTIQYIK